ncbi:hypothetical protein A2U01_0070616, partial [Trifolium medium]|nr:hypothetical protein [Trifolium medium]
MFEAVRNFYRKVNAIGAPKPLIEMTHMMWRQMIFRQMADDVQTGLSCY